MTALHIAVYNKHPTVVRELVKKPDQLQEVLNSHDHVSCIIPQCNGLVAMSKVTVKKQSLPRVR